MKDILTKVPWKLIIALGVGMALQALGAPPAVVDAAKTVLLFFGIAG